jgi:hypothetical protein
LDFWQLIICAAIMALSGCAGLNTSQNAVLERRQQASDIAGLFASGPACFRGTGPELPSGATLEQRGINPFGALWRLTEDSVAGLRPRTIRAGEPPTWRHAEADASQSSVGTDVIRRF